MHISFDNRFVCKAMSFSQYPIWLFSWLRLILIGCKCTCLFHNTGFVNLHRFVLPCILSTVAMSLKFVWLVSRVIWHYLFPELCCCGDMDILLTAYSHKRVADVSPAQFPDHKGSSFNYIFRSEQQKSRDSILVWTIIVLLFMLFLI
jgi:hypothetical protein